jgi:hypothetical protein
MKWYTLAEYVYDTMIYPCGICLWYKAASDDCFCQKLDMRLESLRCGSKRQTVRISGIDQAVQLHVWNGILILEGCSAIYRYLHLINPPLHSPHTTYPKRKLFISTAIVQPRMLWTKNTPTVDYSSDCPCKRHFPSKWLLKWATDRRFCTRISSWKVWYPTSDCSIWK